MNYDVKVRCKFCTRFIPIQAVESSSIRIRCSDRKCKEWNDIKIVMVSDVARQHKSLQSEPKQNIAEMKKKLEELDGRTKEAKELKAEIEELKKGRETDQDYIQQLEGIIDGQG